jgi:hypothetical protein
MAVGEYATWQDPVARVVPATRVQDPEELNVPVPLLANETEPVGVVGLVEVSVTVAVQMDGLLTVTEPGRQVTEVVVVCAGGGVTLTSNVPWLVAWVGSPP